MFTENAQTVLAVLIITVFLTLQIVFITTVSFIITV